MFEWQRLENRHSLICTKLVLHRAANDDLFPTVVPVFRQACGNAFRAFGYYIKAEVRSQTHHLPCVITPRVCFFNEEIRTKTSKYRCAGGYFGLVVSVTVNWQAKGRRLSNPVTVNVVLTITAIDVTIAAAFAFLVASVPAVPKRERHSGTILLILFLQAHHS